MSSHLEASKRTRCGAVIVAVIVAAWAPLAGAQESPSSEAAPEERPRAAERIARGTALFDRQHYDAALTEFLAAYDEMEGHPRRHQVLYNIAFCYERSFRYDEAIRFYERYLAEGGSAEGQAAEVRSILAALEQLLGSVRVETSLAELEVWIDEHRVGEGGGPFRLPAGTHTIEIRAEGHIPARREARVLAGQETRVEVELERIDAFHGLPSEVFAVSAGVTAAALVAGLGVGLASLLEGQSLRARLDPRSPSAWDVTDAEIAAVQQLSLAADILYGASALFAVTTIVFLALTRWRSDEAPVAVGPNGLHVRF